MRRVLQIAFAFILILASFAWTRTRAASAPLPEADYWTLVAQTQSDLRGLDGKSEEEIRLALDGLAGLWSDVSEVERADGTVVPVDVSFLAAALQSDPPNVEQLDGLLGALLQAHETYPQNVFDSSDLDPLHEILSRPEFQWKPNPVGEWIQKMLDRFFAWLDKLLEPFNVSVSVPGGATPITVVAVLILLAILAYVFRGLFADLVKEADSDASAEDDDRNLTSESAFRKAQTLSGQRDYRAAVRYLYLSSLLLMEERGILRYDRSRTNREYLRSVSGHPNLAKPLRSVVDVFDRVWYGFEPLDESSYREYVSEVEELKEQRQ
ncbi:MAG: DUF4129 domain-containing protein [Chloroflexota bacterium]